MVSLTKYRERLTYNAAGYLRGKTPNQTNVVVGHERPGRRDIVKCCGWRRAHPDGLSGGFDVSVLKFNALEDEFNEFVTV